MNNWLQQLTETYKRILKESEGRGSRYFSSSHKWHHVHYPKELSSDGLDYTQRSGSPTGMFVHEHSRQILDGDELKQKAKQEVEAFHRAGEDFETARHGTVEQDGILSQYGLDDDIGDADLTHMRNRDSEDFDHAAHLTIQNAKKKKGREVPHQDRDPHIAHFRSLKK